MTDKRNVRKKLPLRHIVLYTYATIVLIFLLLPTFMIIPISFGGEPYIRFPPKSWSVRWYVEYMSDPEWIRSTLFSLRNGIMTAAAATVVGTMAALALVKGRVVGRSLLNAIVLLPMIVPVIVTGVAMYSVFLRLHLVGTSAGFMLAHTVLAVPYVVLTVSSALVRLDPQLELAAMNLGATRFRAFQKVTLPIIAHGLMSGAAFAFITSFDEAIVSFFLSDIHGKTLTTKIFESVDFNVNPTVAVAGTLLTVISLLLMFAMEWLQVLRRQKSGRRKSNSN